MPTDAERPPSLEEIDSRLAAIRKRRKAKPAGRGAAKWQGAELAWRMVIDLTAGIAVGLTIGWGLDSLFGTMPLFMVVFVLLGFAAGVSIMLRSAEDQRRKALRRAEAEAAAAGGTDETGAAAPRDEGR
ncbi:MAG TPA: AtpZ/AtpI family protein [Paracoccaceae bacterium]|nr:AtpZ/AtpI family protein [Paracoccaceae bacterium]